MDTLQAISPIDGRYRNKVEPLAGYFSEQALIKYRVFVEIEYFIALCELPLPQLQSFDDRLFEKLRDIYRNFSTQPTTTTTETTTTTTETTTTQPTTTTTETTTTTTETTTTQPTTTTTETTTTTTETTTTQDT